MQNYWYTEQNCGSHRHELRLEAVASIKGPRPKKAAQQKHPAGQSSDQSQANTNLFFVRVFGMNIVLKM